MIAIGGLRFAYPDRTFMLTIDELSIADGEKVVFIGPSGCGKTTLLHLVSGILPPESGHITVDGTDVAALSDAARRRLRIMTMGFVFQDFGLIDYLNVLDNVLHPCRITSALKLDGAVRARARELCEAVGIGDKLHRPVTQLSHGERQRVAICRALLTEPNLLLADEATGNLEPEAKQSIMRLLFDFVAESGATLLAVTHDHDILKGFDRVIDFRELNRAEAA